MLSSGKPSQPVLAFSIENILKDSHKSRSVAVQPEEPRHSVSPPRPDKIGLDYSHVLHHPVPPFDNIYNYYSLDAKYLVNYERPPVSAVTSYQDISYRNTASHSPQKACESASDFSLTKAGSIETQNRTHVRDSTSSLPVRKRPFQPEELDTSSVSNNSRSSTPCSTVSEDSNDFDAGMTRRKKPRTAFTAEQVNTLEVSFRSQRYLSEGDRQTMARQLGLKEQQVKTWFQNRRMKEKRKGFEMVPQNVSAPMMPCPPLSLGFNPYMNIPFGNLTADGMVGFPASTDISQSILRHSPTGHVMTAADLTTAQMLQQYNALTTAQVSHT